MTRAVRFTHGQIADQGIAENHAEVSERCARGAHHYRKYRTGRGIGANRPRGP